jgi:hypothetical protein
MVKGEVTKDRQYHGQIETDKDRKYHGQREAESVFCQFLFGHDIVYLLSLHLWP